jgi:hypothetical protein
MAYSRPTYREEFGVRVVNSPLSDVACSQHPEGMQEGSQGQAKRSPWASFKKGRVLEGGQTQRVGQSGEVSRPFRARGFFTKHSRGCASLAPGYLLASLWDAKQFPFVQEDRFAVIGPDLLRRPGLTAVT